jgi:transcriptional regulator with XRE-family HTH domain
MSERLKRLLAEARAWATANEQRGKRSKLAEALGVSRQAVSAWLAANPKKQPTTEQALAMTEFLKKQQRKE